MGRRKSSPKSKRHIYFNRKGVKHDSVYNVVKDVRKPGVDSSSELLKIAGAQLADLADMKTYNHSGKPVKWTKKKWAGRSYILWRLFGRLKNDMSRKEAEKTEKKLKLITKSGSKVMNLKTREARERRIRQVLKRVGFSNREINELLKKTN